MEFFTHLYVDMLLAFVLLLDILSYFLPRGQKVLTALCLLSEAAIVFFAVYYQASVTEFLIALSICALAGILVGYLEYHRRGSLAVREGAPVGAAQTAVPAPQTESEQTTGAPSASDVASETPPTEKTEVSDA